MAETHPEALEPTPANYPGSSWGTEGVCLEVMEARLE
jgi:hypothetical protein